MNQFNKYHPFKLRPSTRDWLVGLLLVADLSGWLIIFGWLTFLLFSNRDAWWGVYALLAMSAVSKVIDWVRKESLLRETIDGLESITALCKPSESQDGNSEK